MPGTSPHTFEGKAVLQSRHTRIAIGTLASIGLVTLAACGNDPQASSSGGGDSSSYAAVIKGLDNPFFQQMEEGINAQAKSDDVNVEVQAAQSITDTNGNKLTIKYSGKFSGDTFKGKREIDRDGQTNTRDFEAKRVKE